MITFPDAYIAYLVEFHASRDFFECHELLEEYWKEHPDDSMADTWVGLIQLAVGLYHERRGNLRGAWKMLTQAELRLSLSPLEAIGLGKQSLLKQLTARIAYLHAGHKVDYTDMNLQILNDELLKHCHDLCEKRGWAWGMPSPLAEESIIHRHKVRDRSDVINARLEAFEAKKRERNGFV